MRKKIEEFGKVLVVVVVFSYATNFIWESLHAAFLYEQHDFNAKNYVRMVSYISGVDSSLILVIYFFVAAVWRELFWLRNVNLRQKIAVPVTGIMIAVGIEYRKVFMLKTWEYSELMPTLFGIGVSPMLQLGITGILTFWMTRRLLYENGIYFKAQ